MQKPPAPGPNRLAALAAPALILLAIVVPFLRYHEYDLLLPESLLLMAGAALVGLAVGAISLLRPPTLVPALTALVLCAFALYRMEIRESVMAGLRAAAEVTGHLPLLLALAGAALFLSLMGVGLLLGRQLPTVVTAFFGTFVLTAIVLPAATGGEHQVAGSLPTELSDLPPVVHIILDEHIGLAALPAELAESEAAAEAVRETYADFALYPRAYSRFGETRFSLAALMNNVPGTDVLPHLDGDGVTHVLRDNAWFDRLKERGYAIRVYQSSWLDMCRDSEAVDVCDTYPLYSINPVQRAPLPTLARLRVLLGKLHIGDVALPAPLAGMEALSRFKYDLKQQPRGVAYIVHLILPHYGYLYRADCSLADPREWRDQPGSDELVTEVSAAARLAAYRLYLAQLTCTDRKIAGVFEQLKQDGAFDDATIVVHGDHGSRIAEGTARKRVGALSSRDLLDHVSTLLAIKAPGLAAGEREAPVAVQQVFAEMLLGREAPDEQPGAVWLQDRATRDFVARTLSWPGLAEDRLASGAENAADPSKTPPQLRPRIE